MIDKSFINTRHLPSRILFAVSSVLVLLFWCASLSPVRAQEITLVPNDSSKLIQFDINKLKESQQKESVVGNLMQPMEGAFTPSALNKYPSIIQYNLVPNSRMAALSQINISGYGSDNFINPTRTAIFSTPLSDKVSIYSANTIGVYRTPLHGNISHYKIDLGSSFIINNQLRGQAGAFYNSSLQNPLPIAGIYSMFNYKLNPLLGLNGGLSYHTTMPNQYDLRQQAVTLDAHVRYRLSDDWFLNGYGGLPVYESNNRPGMPMHPSVSQPYYGGSAEYWFNNDVGLEGGIIWIRDMFTGKMRPTPKFELKFGPKK